MYTLRPATARDQARLRAIHHDAFREPVTALWGWDEALQDTMFNEYFGNASIEVIEVDGTTAGYLDVTRTNDHLFLANVALDPAYQHRGIGTAIVWALIEEARQKSLPLRLEVIISNTRARALYERLGFRRTGENSTHFQMEFHQDT